MKNRLFAFLLVFVFVLSFPVVASADFGSSIVGILLENALESAYNTGDYGFLFGFYPSQVGESLNDLSPQDKANAISSYNKYLKDSDEFDPSTISTGWASNLKPIQFYLEMAARAYGAPALEAGNFHYMIWAEDSYYNYYVINVRIIYDSAHTNDFNYFLNGYNEPCVERANYRPVSCVYAQLIDDTMFGGTNCSIQNGMYDPSRQGCYTGQNMSASNVYCYSTDFVGAPLTFSSRFVLPAGKQLNIFLGSNMVVSDDLFAVAGILYNDGSHIYDGTDCGYINCDFIEGKSLRNGQSWDWGFNLQEFSNWAYRKRIFDTDCFYAFVHVLDGDKIVYADSRKLNLYDPTGIFEDVQPMPDPDDYKPTPTPYPTLPDNTFDFTSNNNYTTYNYDTVNNYDSTTQNFNEWLGDTITIINNNVSGGLDSIDNNLRIIGDNINDFSTSVKNYIEGGSVALNEYIGDLIIKFNNDFLSWTDSFGKYLGDLLNTINLNIQIISDNILNYFKSQLVPDEDYLNFLFRECCPWYYQIRDIFDSASSSSSSFSLYLPGLDYTYVLSDGELASQLRSVLTYCLYAFTVISCVRIGFQIFGIHIFPGGDDT